MINSRIEWCDHTANLWHGCSKVHEGCNNCYAEAISNRYGRKIWGMEMPRLEIKKVWDELHRFQLLAEASQETHRVFVGSMMDIFEKPMLLINHKNEKSTIESTEILRQRFFREVVPTSPNLQFLLLTKRPSNINKYIPEAWKTDPPANVMFGTSPANQATFNTLVRQLKAVNGRRFLSIEPQLEAIELGALEGIDWIIQGGESGPNKRPFNLEWAYKMKEQCTGLGIPYFFKQIDKIKPIPPNLMVRQWPAINCAVVQ